MKLRSSHYEQQVMLHCQFPEDRILHGTEGVTKHPNATLVSFLAVVRHGDRYGIRRIKTEECQELDEQETKWFDDYLEVAEKQGLPSLLKMSTEVEKLRKVPDKKKCESRTLTPRGAVQEFSLGMYFSEKYRNTELFDTSRKPINLTMTTSQKQRTVASGIALVSGLLNQNHTKFKTPVVFKSSKFYYGCTEAGCDCDKNFGKIDNLARKEREGMFRMEAPEKIKKMANLTSPNNTIDTPSDDPNQILDYLVAEHACQRKPLPCEQKHCASYLYVGDVS